MVRLRPVSWKELEKVVLSEGWVFDRQKGSHRMYKKPGAQRPQVIPEHKEIKKGTLKSILTALNLSQEEFYSRLDSL